MMYASSSLRSILFQALLLFCCCSWPISSFLPFFASHNNNIKQRSATTTTTTTTRSNCRFQNNNNNNNMLRSTSTSTTTLSIASSSDDIITTSTTSELQEMPEAGADESSSTATNEDEEKDEDQYDDDDDYLLFNDFTWNAYKEIMLELMESPRVLKKAKSSQEYPQAVAFLLSPPTTKNKKKKKKKTTTTTVVVVGDDKEAAAEEEANGDNDDTTTTTTITTITTTSTPSKTQQFKIDYGLAKEDDNDENDDDDDNDDAQYDYITRCLIYMGDACAKRKSTGHPIVVAFHKLQQTNITPRERCISTYMYILSNNLNTMNTNTNNNNNNTNNKSENDNNDNDNNDNHEQDTLLIADALNQVATFHDTHFQPTETTISLRIKYLIESQNDIQQAEQFLASCVSGDGGGGGGGKSNNNNHNNNDDDGSSSSSSNLLIQKLRTFLPIVEYHCKVSKSPYDILRVYHDMQQAPGTFLDAEFYGLMVGSLARLGVFSGDGGGGTADDNSEEDDIHRRRISLTGEGLQELGYVNTNITTQGPQLFDEIAAKLADDILEVPEAVAKDLFDGFVKGFLDDNDDDTDGIPTWDSVKDSGSIATIGRNNNNNNNNKDINDNSPSRRRLTMGRVVIDDTTALCPTTNAKLRLFALDETQRQHVHDTLLIMARLRHEEFSKQQKKKAEGERPGDDGFESLSAFSKWLDTRDGDPYTVIIDGPNVAYYGHGNVHYSQIKLLVDELEKMGEKPLVTMSTKYTRKSFTVGGGRWQHLKNADQQIIKSLVDEEKMYVVPPRCLDDYYWMLASVSNQTTARSHEDLRVSVNDQEGRFPGLRPMLVTNDQMRDHKLELLEPREFRRWSSCHIVNYNISSYDDNEEEPRDVEFFPADFFSREIQGNKHGNGNGLVWHFPVSEWDDADRFFISIAQ